MPWQPLAVEFPDVELLVTGALRTLLVAEGESDVFVSRSIPNPRRARMVVVNRDGGPDDGITDRPRVRLRVWGSSAQDANELARMVAALMHRLAGTTAVTHVHKESGPYEVPDTSGAHQRYLLFELRTQHEGVLS